MNVVITRSNRKTVTIKVVNENTISARVPLGFPQTDLDKILREKEDWIGKVVAKIKNNKTSYDSLYAYNQIMLCGKVLPVAFSDEPKPFLSKNIDCVYVNEKCVNSADLRKKELLKFISNYAKTNLPQLVAYLGQKMQLCPAQTTITKIRGANVWGKCTYEKSIILDVRIICLPIPLQEYIVAHEFAHLLHFDHSKEFWLSLSAFVPDCKQRRKEMRNFYFLREVYA